MRLLLSFTVVLFVTVLTTVLSAPVEDKVEQVSTASVPVVDEQKEIESVSAVPITEVQEEESEEEVATTPGPQDEDVVEKSEKKGRRLEEEDDDEEGEGDQDDEDDDEDEDEDEEEEEERKLTPSNKGVVKASPKKKTVPGKPVPVLGEGVEDDEAEDLGIFEREEPKSDEVDRKPSDEEKSDEDKDDEDESGEDEERDDPIGGPSGLVAEPGSSERLDVEAVSSPVQNEVVGAEQPLAVAVVQPEETSDPVVPIIVEETGPQQVKGQGKVESSLRKQKPKPVQDDDDDDDDEEDDDDDEDSRSEKLHRHRARSAYNPSPVLYYYPFPEAPAA